MYANVPRSLGGQSRPRTPPASSNRGTPTPPPSAGLSRVLSPSKPSYSTTLSKSSSSWHRDLNETDDDDEDDDFVYDDEEDEFGLPSLASMRRKKAKSSELRNSTDPGGGAVDYVEPKGLYDLNYSAPTSSKRSNSFDIAEERNALAYPSAKKAEGKILRPQYKEILRGPCRNG